jgi:hypothetical protein
VSSFPSAAHLVAWAGRVLGLQESADRRTPGGCAAWKQVLTLRAQVAVIHSTLVSAYYMLCRDQPYRDLGPDRLRRYDDEAHARRLIAQLEG